MNARLFWKSLAVQAVVVAIPFAILGAALDKSFFEDWGWLVGPAVWLLCSLATARILRCPWATSCSRRWPAEWPARWSSWPPATSPG